MNIFVNNNTNFKFFLILSIYTIWDGLSQKTISRYCPFKSGFLYKGHEFPRGDHDILYYYGLWSLPIRILDGLFDCHNACG